MNNCNIKVDISLFNFIVFKLVLDAMDKMNCFDYKGEHSMYSKPLHTRLNYNVIDLLHTYHISLNYSRSHINAWCHLVAGGSSIIAKINAGFQINAGSFVDPQ